jgi:hypothetical protein
MQPHSFHVDERGGCGEAGFLVFDLRRVQNLVADQSGLRRSNFNMGDCQPPLLNEITSQQPENKTDVILEFRGFGEYTLETVRLVLRLPNLSCLILYQARSLIEPRDPG